MECVTKLEGACSIPVDENYDDEWCVFAEGNRHIVFRPKHITNAHFGFIVKALKLPKLSSLAVPHQTALYGHENDSDTIADDYEQHYIENTTQRWLTNKYISSHRSIRLSPDTVASFYRCLLNQSRYDVSFGSVVTIERDLTTLYRHPYMNYHRYQTRCPSAASLVEIKSPLLSVVSNQGQKLQRNVISFEFKLKCGFRSISPFIVGHPYDNSSSHDTNDDVNLTHNNPRLIKLQYGRYHLMQLSKLYQYTQQGKNPRWGKLSHGMSHYDPSDMMFFPTLPYSNSTSMTARNHIKNALMCLLENPQNNLKITHQGVHVYGWEIQHKKDEMNSFLENLFHNFLSSPSSGSINSSHPCNKSSSSNNIAPTTFVAVTVAATGPMTRVKTPNDDVDNTTNNTSISRMLDSVVCILQSEDLLHRILLLQTLEVLDVEGVEAVYHHLVQLLSLQVIDSSSSSSNSSCCCICNCSSCNSDSSSSSIQNTINNDCTEICLKNLKDTINTAEASGSVITAESLVLLLMEQRMKNTPLDPCVTSVLEQIARFRLQQQQQQQENPPAIKDFYFTSNFESDNNNTTSSNNNNTNTKEDMKTNINRNAYASTHSRYVTLLQQMMNLSIYPDPIMSSTERHLRSMTAKTCWLKSLSIDDCTFILQCFLIALGAKDVSVIVTMENVTDTFNTDGGGIPANVYNCNDRDNNSHKTNEMTNISDISNGSSVVTNIKDDSIRQSISSLNNHNHHHFSSTVSQTQAAVDDDDDDDESCTGWKVISRVSDNNDGLLQFNGRHIASRSCRHSSSHHEPVVEKECSSPTIITEVSFVSCSNNSYSSSNNSSNSSSNSSRRSSSSSDSSCSSSSSRSSSSASNNFQLDTDEANSLAARATAVSSSPPATTITTTTTVAYSITAIDIGPKPVSKIIEKIQQEEGICIRAVAAAAVLANRID